MNHLAFTCLLVVSLISITGCGGCSRDASDHVPSGRLNSNDPVRHQSGFDFGKVSIDDGPRTLKHAFAISNNHRTTRRIAEIVKSCGCLDATPDSLDLSPGSQITFTVSMDIAYPGRTEHSATITYDDGQSETYSLIAYGTRRDTITVVPARIRLSTTSVRLAFQVQVTGDSLDMHTPPPSVSHRGRPMPIHFDGWSVIEHASPARPARLIGSVGVDIDEVGSDFPVFLDVAVTDEVAATLIVEQRNR